MAIYNPPHPSEFISKMNLKPHGVSGRGLAVKLDVAPTTLSCILNGGSRITPEMALRLSKAIGQSLESWLTMQDSHDLWGARQQTDLVRVNKLEFNPA